jgi:hypothetical protein
MNPQISSSRLVKFGVKVDCAASGAQPTVVTKVRGRIRMYPSKICARTASLQPASTVGTMSQMP